MLTETIFKKMTVLDFELLCISRKSELSIIDYYWDDHLFQLPHVSSLSLLLSTSSWIKEKILTIYDFHWICILQSNIISQNSSTKELEEISILQRFHQVHVIALDFMPKQMIPLPHFLVNSVEWTVFSKMVRLAINGLVVGLGAMYFMIHMRLSPAKKTTLSVWSYESYEYCAEKDKIPSPISHQRAL